MATIPTKASTDDFTFADYVLLKTAIDSKPNGAAQSFRLPLAVHGQQLTHNFNLVQANFRFRVEVENETGEPISGVGFAPTGPNAGNLVFFNDTQATLTNCVFTLTATPLSR